MVLTIMAVLATRLTKLFKLDNRDADMCKTGLFAWGAAVKLAVGSRWPAPDTSPSRFSLSCDVCTPQTKHRDTGTGDRSQDCTCPRTCRLDNEQPGADG